MSNADIARWGFAAIARGDFDAVAEFLDSEVKWQPCRSANLATFRDGRVVEMVHYDDAAQALAALDPPTSAQQ